MDKRIKALYIITIIAIISFLEMQFYWLYGRYVSSLLDYERNLKERISGCVDDYYEIRGSSSENDSKTEEDKSDDEITMPSFSLRQEYGDTIKTVRTVKIMTYRYSAYDLLNIDSNTPLTEQLKNQAMELAAQSEKLEPADAAVYDASGAKDENEAWYASKNLQLERKSPFTVEGIDSILKKEGINARISLAKADSTVWRTEIEYNKSVFHPKLSMTIPYSQLEGQTVNFLCHINPFEILPGMWQTLIISIVISSLLIVCLVLQFSTVLKLSRLDKMRNSFITTMIHELKRPISTLKMCVSGLDNERMMENRVVKKEILSETRNSLDNLSAYFSKLRDITFNDVEQIPLNIHTINLHELFDAVATATLYPAEKSVVIRNEIDSHVEISADRSHLYNILNNLIENSIKYSDSSVEIKAAAVENNGYVDIKISDNGNGIPSGDIKHIFKRFYRGKASAGEQPGMGLGLAYVKLLTDAHGGDIYVESSEGKGTSFTIRFPQ